MEEARRTRLWVALPDSLFSESPSLREKTEKVGQIGRALAIYGVEKAFIYTDEGGGHKKDGGLLKLLLEYMDTPQYLRQRIYPLTEDLKYAGILPPLRTPHHPGPSDASNLEAGSVRQGVVVRERGGLSVDVGLPLSVPLDGWAAEGRRVTVVFTKGSPKPRCQVADTSDLKEYWGYQVIEAQTLGRLVKAANPDFVIATSRRGAAVNMVWSALVKALAEAKRLLIAFGSPRRGLHEILADEKTELEDLATLVINTIPGQQTATVRTEEALYSALAVINLAARWEPS